jgi:hypothetical protein
MEWSDYPIVGSFNNQNISEIDSERTVNLFEYVDPEGKKPKSLISTAGLTNTGLEFSGSTNGFRGQFVFKDVSYFVIGVDIYAWDGVLPPSKINGSFPLTTFEGYVGIDANTFQIIFVDGQKGYIYDTTSGSVMPFVEITDISFPTKPIDVCYLDGFFVVANGDTNQFQLSMFNNGLVWGVAENNFTASATTNLLTLTAGTTENYATGVPVTFIANDPGSPFASADTSNDWIVLTTASSNYITGSPIKFTGASLPTTTPQIVTGTEYYAIMDSTTHIGIATTYANAIANTRINITATGAGTVIAQLPDPLVEDTTYYVIHVSSTTLKVATTYANAVTNTPIILLSNGGPSNEIRSQGQLQLGQITSHPGTLVACRTLHRRIFFFCQNFTEVWENAGAGTNLPFRRNNALLMEVGTPSRWSVAVGFDKMFFLSQDAEGLSSVMQVDGTQARPISSRAIDFAFSQYAAGQLITVNDPSSILIKQNGLIFYRLNFTLANHTYVYDVSLSQAQDNMWHEEEVLNGDRHPAQTHMYFKGINYYGNYLTPIMYIVDANNSTNDGESIKRMRIGKPIVDPTYKRRRIDRFHLDLLQGNVDNIPQNIAPIVYLSYSKDGGQTYGSRLTAPMGAIGERTFRTVWRKLGVTPRGQAFVPKIEFFNQVPFIILGAAWVFEVLPE